MKPKIYLLAGPSGCGKSTIADYIEQKYDVPMIQSHTDRPKRTPDENGHTFHTKEEMDEIWKGEKIAHTTFGNNRYCCLKEDVKPINTYVIDEHGIDYLETNFGHMYNLVRVFVQRPYNVRLKAIGEERIKRDEDMYNRSAISYDYFINNCGSRSSLENQVDFILQCERLK